MSQDKGFDADYARTKVQIMGRHYTLKGDVDSEYMQKLAQYVNEKVNELKEMAPGLDQTRLALLVSLNMADELFQAKAHLKGYPSGISGIDEEKLKEINDRAQRLISMLEEGLIGEI